MEEYRCVKSAGRWSRFNGLQPIVNATKGHEAHGSDALIGLNCSNFFYKTVFRIIFCNMVLGKSHTPGKVLASTV